MKYSENSQTHTSYRDMLQISNILLLTGEVMFGWMQIFFQYIIP